MVARVFELARLGQLGLGDLFAVAEKLGQVGNHELAATLYRSWLDHTETPVAHLGWYNYAVALSTLRRHAESEAALRRALDLNPTFLQARFALGSELERQERTAEAAETWRAMIPELDAGSAEGRALAITVFNNLGRILEGLKQLQEAEEMFTRSLGLDPRQADVIWHWLHARQKQCAWPIYKSMKGLSRGFLERHTSPLALLSAVDDPVRQLEAARAYAKKLELPPQPPCYQSRHYGHDRLRVGYFSSDLCLHPVAMLIVELLELHDRAEIELFVFCWTRDDGSAVRRRVIAAAEHFVPIGAMSDEEAARCIAGHEIDVLVDLQGLTAGCRAGVLARRPAPVQITYLGFPGVTALPGVDYVLADHYVIPEDSARFFAERPLYLPRVFQTSDRRREMGPKPARADCGLPEDAVVLCCFNNSYKFTSELFAVWVNILRHCPRTVLWLLADNVWQQQNLTQAWTAAGLDPARLVFGGRVAPPDYLARYQLADLFLDTYPFNAGTTANDALWMGLPVLTRSGRTFASRMAGSLLQAVGLPELITTSFREYEDKAVALAQNPAALAALRQRLEQGRDRCDLFDMPRLTREIEALYRKTVKAGGESSPPATACDRVIIDCGTAFLI
ncbi:protein O-GlcNAc transferase [Azospirillaceae bacterium]